MDRASSASPSPHRTPQMGAQSGETSSGGGSPASSTLSTSSVAAAAAGGASARAGGQKAAKSAKVCGVCGDRAKSYHFGGVSCDSCKAFFRRSVQNDAHRAFQCPYDSKCEITINSRKCCQFCRFRKCLDIGMEKSWVMTEEERLQLLKQRMERKGSISKPGTSASAGASTAPAAASSLAEAPLLDSPAGSTRGASPAVFGDVSLASTSSSQSMPAPEGSVVADQSSPLVLDASELAATRDIVSKYESSFRQVPYPVELLASNDKRTLIEVITFFTTTIKRITHFAGQLNTFQALPRTDQAALLRCGMIEMCLIRAAYAYDPARGCWPDTSLPLYADSPYLRVEDLRRLVSPELHTMHMKFNHDVRHLAQLDEATYMLLLLVVMFSPERPGLTCGDLVTGTQDHYLILLRRYMAWRHSPQVAAKLYPRLLLKLPDLRQLNDAHNQSHLELTSRDIREIQHQFGIILHGYSIEGTSAAVTATPPPQRHHHDDNGNATSRTPPPRSVHSGMRTASPMRDTAERRTPLETTPGAFFESVPWTGHHTTHSQSDAGRYLMQPSVSGAYRPAVAVSEAGRMHRAAEVEPALRRPHRRPHLETMGQHELPPSFAGPSSYREAGPSSQESPSTSEAGRLHILCPTMGPAWFDAQQASVAASGEGDDALGGQASSAMELRRPPLRHAVSSEWHSGTTDLDHGEKPP